MRYMLITLIIVLFLVVVSLTALYLHKKRKQKVIIEDQWVLLESIHQTPFAISVPEYRVLCATDSFEDIGISKEMFENPIKIYDVLETMAPEEIRKYPWTRYRDSKKRFIKKELAASLDLVHTDSIPEYVFIGTGFYFIDIWYRTPAL